MRYQAGRARVEDHFYAGSAARVLDQPEQDRLDGARRGVAVRAGDAARLVRDPGGQRGREGGPGQGGRLPDDRGHRAGVPVRVRGRRTPGGRGRRARPAEPGVTMQPGADTEAIRALVREVLADLLPAASQDPGNPGAAGQAHGPGWSTGEQGGPAQAGLPHTVREPVESVEVVTMRTDADLGAFVLHLLHLFENPKHRDAVRSGRLRFRLAATAVPGSAQPSHRIEKGAVTEAMVAASARAGARLVLGRRAVLTPLARDRARATGVEIVKER